MPTAGFEPAILLSKRRQTHASDLVASGTDISKCKLQRKKSLSHYVFQTSYIITPLYSHQQKASKYQNMHHFECS